MDDLRSIDTLLKQINWSCLCVQRKALGILKTVKYEGKEIAKDIQEVKPHIDLQTILTMLQNEAIKLSEESEKISEELKVFNIALANGTDIEKSGCEILRDVWFGDAYDGLTGYNSLIALKKDLKRQERDTNLEFVIEKVVNIGNIKEDPEKCRKREPPVKKRGIDNSEKLNTETDPQKEMHEKILEDFPEIIQSRQNLDLAEASREGYDSSEDLPQNTDKSSMKRNDEYYDSDEYDEDSN